MLFDVVAINIALNFVRQQNVDQVALFSRFRGRNGFETVAPGKVVVGTTRTLSNDNVATAVAKVLCLSMSLASVADDSDRLVFQETQICVVVVVNLGCHGIRSCCWSLIRQSVCGRKFRPSSAA